MRFKHFILILISIVLFSCEGEQSGGKKSSSLLPKASGRAGEMIVVMDSVQWKGELGDAIRGVFLEEVKGLPREESMFKLNRVDPQKFNDVLKTVKNLLFVVTLDSNTPDSRVVQNYFTKSSIKKIKENNDLFVYTSEDIYARGQEAMYLFGQTEEALIEKIKLSSFRLQKYFNDAENKRLRAGLFKAKEKEGITDLLVEDHDCYMRIPFGYKLVVNQPGFLWVRQINDESDKNIFVAYTPYRSESSFSNEAIISFRDSVARRQLFEDPADPATHLLTETEVPFIPVVSNQIDFKGKYAMKTRGLWRTNNKSMGGPFMSYTIYDEATGRLYYIEGFLYSPGKNQREYMREIEVILSTFRTKPNIPESSN